MTNRSCFFAIVAALLLACAITGPAAAIVHIEGTIYCDGIPVPNVPVSLSVYPSGTLGCPSPGCPMGCVTAGPDGFYSFTISEAPVGIGWQAHWCMRVGFSCSEWCLPAGLPCANGNQCLNGGSAVNTYTGTEWITLNITLGIGAACTGGGCPTVFSELSGNWVLENTILGRSLAASFMTDYCRLRTASTTADGRIRLMVRETEREFATLDQFRLVAIDHPADVDAHYYQGKFMLARQTDEAASILRKGAGIEPLGTGDRLAKRDLMPGDEILLGRPRVGRHDPRRIPADEKGLRRAPPRTSLADMDRAVLDGTGIVVEARNAGGEWTELRHFYPQDRATDLLFSDGGYDEVRLRAIGQHGIGQMQRLEIVDPEPSHRTFAPVVARHSRRGDVRAALRDADGHIADMDPGDEVYLEFAVAPVRTGMVRTLFLVSTGVYSAVDPSESDHSVSQGASVARAELSPPEPNPTTGNTQLEFSLPSAAHVRLDIFDLQGRRVENLVDGVLPAGRHIRSWELSGSHGPRVGPGAYYARLSGGGWSVERAIVVVR